MTHCRHAADLFDNLVSAYDERFRDGQANRLGSDQVDNEIEFGGLLKRNVRGLGATEDFVDEIGGATPQVRLTWSIGHQTSRFDVLPSALDGRQSRSHCQDVDPKRIRARKRVLDYIKRLRAAIES